MGLIKLAFNITDFEEAIKLAKKGDRYAVDLKVADIYEPEDDRVDKMFRELTAASLGKIDKDFDVNGVKKEDFINALLCLIAENIGTIAYLMAENNHVDHLIFCGGFLKNNRIMRRNLTLICNYYKKKAVFLKNSEFTGVIGSLVS